MFHTEEETLGNRRFTHLVRGRLCGSAGHSVAVESQVSPCSPCYQLRFSNSKSSWCSGRITQVSSDKAHVRSSVTLRIWVVEMAGEVKVVYQPPGASNDDWLEKELLGQLLSTSSAELFSHRCEDV